MSRKSLIVLLSLLLAHLALLIFFAANRTVGNDEGFYLSAARMVGLGKAPYVDFFFSQAILFPLAFSSMALDGWSSFWILRGFAVAAGLLSALLLFGITLNMTRNLKVALLALGMYAFSGLTLSIHSIFEPLVFANLLALATFFFWLKFHERRKIIFLVLLGLSLSALLNMRLIFGILLPIYAYSIWRLETGRRLKAALVFAVALVPFSIPNLVMLLRAPDYFLKDTFIFQIFRGGDANLAVIFLQKLSVIAKMIIEPSLFILLVAVIFSLRFMRQDGRLISGNRLFESPEGMALLNLFALAAVYLVPFPVLRHYAEQYLAFAIIVASIGAERLVAKVQEILPGKRQRLATGGLAMLLLLSLVPYYAIFINGIRAQDQKYMIAEVERITSQMRLLATESDTVLSEWAGYPFFAEQVPLPMTEILGFEYPLPFSHEERMKYKLCDNIYLKNELSRQTPALAVIINEPPAAFAATLDSGYSREYQTGAVSIYKRR
jgi:hypothetical protein